MVAPGIKSSEIISNQYSFKQEYTENYYIEQLNNQIKNKPRGQALMSTGAAVVVDKATAREHEPIHQEPAFAE